MIPKTPPLSVIALFATLILVACSGPTQQSTTSGGGAVDLGPINSGPFVGASAVWDALRVGAPANPDLVHTLLNDCGQPADRNDCVAQQMMATGASQDAIDFFKSTGWFLIDFRPGSSKVALGVILMPWRANANQEYVLLNGTPGLVYPEDEGAKLTATTAPGYQTLAASLTAPPTGQKLDIFPADVAFEDLQAGLRYVFQYSIANGCHACGTGYNARVSFEFDDLGRFTGARVLGICRATATNNLSGINPCPKPSP